MASRSSRQKNGSSNQRDAVALLLRDGRTIQSPSDNVLSQAATLEQSGLIAVSRCEYVLCAEPKDRDFPWTKNRSCRGQVYLRGGADEAGHEYRCSECERVVFPLRYQKVRHTELQIAVCADAVIRHVCDRLTPTGATLKEMSRAVFRIEGGSRDIFVGIVELCGDEAYLTRDWARTQPTLYVAVDESTMNDRFLPETWVTKACLADVVCGNVQLRELVDQLARNGTPREMLNASVPLYTTGPRPIVAQSCAPAQRERRFVVEVGKRTVQVNGVQVVAPQSKIRLRVFEVLWKQYLDDVSAGAALIDYAAMSIEKMEKRLQAAGVTINDEMTIRRAVNRLQEDIETAVKKELGDPIGREDIIETIRKAGQLDTNFGYRINPHTVVVRPFSPATSAIPATSCAASASLARRQSGGPSTP